MRGVNHLPLRPVCAAWKSLASAAGLEAGAAAHEMAACVEIERETDRQRRVPAAVGVLQCEVDRGNRVRRDLLKFEILRTGADLGVAAGLPGAHHIGEVEMQPDRGDRVWRDNAHHMHLAADPNDVAVRQAGVAGRKNGTR